MKLRGSSVERRNGRERSLHRLWLSPPFLAQQRLGQSDISMERLLVLRPLRLHPAWRRGRQARTTRAEAGGEGQEGPAPHLPCLQSRLPCDPSVVLNKQDVGKHRNSDSERRNTDRRTASGPLPFLRGSSSRAHAAPLDGQYCSFLVSGRRADVGRGTESEHECVGLD